MQGRLVAEQGVIGVGGAGAAVQLAQEAVEAGARPHPPSHRGEKPGGVLGDRPAVLDGVALDEAAAAQVVVAGWKGAIFVARLDQAAAAVEELAPVARAADQATVGPRRSPRERAANWAIAKSSTAYSSEVAAEPQTASGLP